MLEYYIDLAEIKKAHSLKKLICDSPFYEKLNFFHEVITRYLIYN